MTLPSYSSTAPFIAFLVGLLMLSVLLSVAPWHQILKITLEALSSVLKKVE